MYAFEQHPNVNPSVLLLHFAELFTCLIVKLYFFPHKTWDETENILAEQMNCKRPFGCSKLYSSESVCIFRMSVDLVDLSLQEWNTLEWLKQMKHIKGSESKEQERSQKKQKLGNFRGRYGRHAVRCTTVQFKSNTYLENNFWTEPDANS